MDRNKTPHDPHHLGFLSGVSKMIYACGTFDAKRAPTLHKNSHYLPMDKNDLSLEPRHLGVPSGTSKTISKPTVHSVQNVHLSCVKISTIF
jgi:hypothetical protein